MKGKLCALDWCKGIDQAITQTHRSMAGGTAITLRGSGFALGGMDGKHALTRVPLPLLALHSRHILYLLTISILLSLTPQAPWMSSSVPGGVRW
jgi:hypothetical protein